jgi:predicted PurR-regulated permease PerM
MLNLLKISSTMILNMFQNLIKMVPKNENKVYKLVKSLYELKQAPKQWHKKFDTVINLMVSNIMELRSVFIQNSQKIMVSLFAFMLMTC